MKASKWLALLIGLSMSIGQHPVQAKESMED